MVWFVAEVAVDEVDEVVGEVQEALQDVAHTLGAGSCAAKHFTSLREPHR